MDSLIPVLIVVALLALVGHGIWVLVGWTFRSLGRLFDPGPPEPIRAAMCPECGALWDARGGLRHCVLCGWPPQRNTPRRPARPEQILNYLQRRIERYQQLGMLSDQTGGRLVQAIRAEIRPDPDRAVRPRLEPAPIATDGPPRMPAPVPEVVFQDAPVPVLEPVGLITKPATATGDVIERAHAYRTFLATEAAQAQADTQASTPPPTPVPAGDRSQRFFELLSAFLEQKNIRWGEIVGGLLIVGCSLALVLSFWSSIAERPLLKFGVFTGITALLFALGFHAERRWKLPTTALGLMIIATLLIPLNFLAVASLSRRAMGETAAGLAGEVVAVMLFAALGYRAGRSIVSRTPVALVAGVMVPSLAMLLIRRFINPSGGLTGFLALGALPVFAQEAAVLGLIERARREPEIDEPLALDLLRLLGLTTFATALALGLLLALGGPLASTLHRAAPLAPLAGAPALASGLFLWRRTTAAKLVGYRTAGTAIAAAGVLVMLAGVAMGWPDPSGMVPVALLNFAVLTAIAIVFAVPPAHVLAGLCLGLAYLLVWLVVTGDLGWSAATPDRTAKALLSSRGGSALVPIALLFEAAAAAGLRLGRRLDAQAYALVAALAAAISLGLVTAFGSGLPGDPAGVTWVYASYALAAMAGAGWFGRAPLVSGADSSVEARTLGWLGSGLVLAAFVQGTVFGPWLPGLSSPWAVAMLAHATLALASAAALNLWPGVRSTTGTVLGDLLARSALATSAIAAVLLAVAIPSASSSSLAVRLLWLSLVGLALAWRFAAPGLFAAFQGVLAGAVVFAVAAALERQDWYAGSPHAWLDPWSLQAQGLALGMLGLVWIGARLGVRAWFVDRSQPHALAVKAWQLLDPPWPAFDRYLLGTVVLILVGLTLIGVIPGAAQELTPGDPAWARVVPPAAAFEVDGIPHRHALGIGSWALLGLVLLGLVAGQWERFRRTDVLGALLAATMAVPLLAGRWESEVAAASALRWLGALFLLGASIVIWYRSHLARWLIRMGWRVEPEAVAGLKGMAIGTLFVQVLMPLLAVTLFVLAAVIYGNPVVGPDPGSFFARLGPASSYAIPIMLVAATLVGYAIRERSSESAFAAGLVLNLAATLAYELAAGHGSLTGIDLVRLAQINAIVASLTVLAWIGAVAVWRRRNGQEGPAPSDLLLNTMMALGVALNVLILIAMTSALFLDPVPAPAHAASADLWGWAALLLAAGSVVAWGRGRGRPLAPDWIGFGLLGVADFLALGLVFRDRGGWLTYHGILAGQGFAGGILVLTAWQRSGMRLSAVPAAMRAAVVRWATLALFVSVLFALGAYFSDPQAPWWTVGGLSCMAMLAATLAGWSRRRSFLVLGAVLLNLAATLGWLSSSWFSGARSPGSLLADILHVNIIAMALPAPVWLWIERRLIRPDEPGAMDGWPPRRQWPAPAGTIPFQRVVAWLALGLTGLVLVLGLIDDAAGGEARPLVLLGGSALGAATVAMAAGLWDERSRTSVAGLYLLGLCAAGWIIYPFHLPARWLVWTGTMVLSAFSVATSFLWSRRAVLRAWADRLGIPHPDAEEPHAGLAWLAPASLVVAALVLLLAFGTILNEPDGVMRSLAANAALAEVLAIGLLAHGERRLRLQSLALCVGVAGAVALGWAGIAPDSPSRVLDRLVFILVALTAAGALYGLGLVKLFPKETEWTAAARKLVPGMLGLAALMLAVVLGEEAVERLEEHAVAISVPAVAAVAAALIGAVVAALVAALVPGRDPLGLSERGRTAYVYGCEVLLVLLAVHLKLTVLWWYTGFFARYGSLVVLGIAFLGVGMSELFRRLGQPVLAEPLERTGALLPVLPLLAAFWTAPRPGEDVVFLVLAGGLYTTLSLLRSSLGFGALAALAFNGALWVMLGRWEGFGFLEHPQLWVIPPALCVLVGTYLNRDRLDEAQLTSIRHATSLAIYLSSTVDIVLTGVAQAPWLPLVLAGLSLAGIFAGILLRIRGFVLLGTGFLGLAVFTVIWYAAVDLRQTWIWWASGIVAGILILALFAVFEKKRQEVLHMVDQFKEWSP